MQGDLILVNFRLHPSFICAGGDEGKDACFGDGGGPLVCHNKYDSERYVQVKLNFNFGRETEILPKSIQFWPSIDAKRNCMWQCVAWSEHFTPLSISLM